MEQPCPRCHAAPSAVLRHCPTCAYDLGAPNVREAGADAERSALQRRSTAAEAAAASRGVDAEWGQLLSILGAASAVVVCMPAEVALSLVLQPNNIFENYEKLVGSEARLPAAAEADRRRRGVVGILFGTYGGDVRYGVLSLNGEGPGSYGEVSCQLREIAILDRVSFLECNSYVFVEQHHLTPGSLLPGGYRAVWDNRHLLAGTKLEPQLRRGQTPADWQTLLLHGRSSNRAEDEFVEAHIFGSFTIDAVETMKLVQPLSVIGSAKRRAARTALALFDKRRKPTAGN